jgi:mannose-6-phosphate isomerase-like protein (cupin superfamily)
LISAWSQGRILPHQDYRRSHQNEDELFLVLKGCLRIELEGHSVELGEGEMYIVPRGVKHNPVAGDECHLMLVERKSTQHTGEVVTDHTRSVDDQLHNYSR